MLIPYRNGMRLLWMASIGVTLCLLAQGQIVAAGTVFHLKPEGKGACERQEPLMDLAGFRTPPFSLAPNLIPFQRMRETFHAPMKLLPVFPVLGTASLPFSSGGGGLVREEASSPHKLDNAFLRRFGNDFVDCFLAPAGWSQRDFFRLSVLLGGGFILFATDEDVQDWVQEHRTPASDDASRIIGPMGGGAVLGSLIVSLYLSGELFHQDSLRHTALQSLESWVISGVMVAGLKFLTGRARPTPGATSTTFKPFAGRSRYYSLPSGHTSSIFAVATVIANKSTWFWSDVLSYTLAALVAGSRVHDNEHWPSDVFFGAALGYFVGKRISSAEKTRDSGVRLTFLSDSSGFALSLSVRL